jgi:pimeloyl-ACP methyl ester carboxylesterase
LRRHDPAAFDIRVLSAEENRELLSSIDVTTLLVHGGRSDICDSDLAAGIARSIGNCSVVEFAECNHGLPLQQPERLVTVVREFLT